MSEQGDSANERLEGLLRQWGADEAMRSAGGAATPPRAVPTRAGGERLPWAGVLRWALPSAAAAVLLVAALYVFSLGGGYTNHAAEDHGAAPASEAASERQAEEAPEKVLPDAEVVSLRQQLSTAQDRAERQAADLEDSRDRVAELRAKLDDADPAGQRERIDTLMQAVAAAEEEARKARKAAETLQGRLDEHKRLLAERETEVDELRGALSKAESGWEEALKKARARAEAAERRLAAAGGELERLRRMNDTAMARAEDLAAELSRVEARHAAMMSDFTRAYLAAAGRRGAGLTGYQRAAGDARIVERASRLASGGGEAAELLGVIEVVFTRLDMLDPQAPGAAKGFAALVDRTDVLTRIEQALAGRGGGPDLRMLLFEAKLILTGARDAA